MEGYRGPVPMYSLESFYKNAFGVQSNGDEFNIPYTQFVLALKEIKNKLNDSNELDVDTLIIPQFDPDTLMDNESRYNPLSKDYIPIQLFNFATIGIYFPLIYKFILLRFENLRDVFSTYFISYYQGFILRDIIPPPKFDTGVYMYRLSGTRNGEPLFIYKENRYHMVDYKEKVEIEFVKGNNRRLLDLPDETKFFYYKTVLQGLIEDTLDLANVKLLDNNFNIIEKIERDK